MFAGQRIVDARHFLFLFLPKRVTYCFWDDKAKKDPLFTLLPFFWKGTIGLRSLEKKLTKGNTACVTDNTGFATGFRAYGMSTR